MSLLSVCCTLGYHHNSATNEAYFELLLTTFASDPTSPPSNLSGHTTFSSILELSWAPPPVLDQNGVITSYVVKVCALETDTVWTMFALEESIQIGSLNLSYSYNFTVAASTSVGIGPFSQGITLKIDNSS